MPKLSSVRWIGAPLAAILSGILVAFGFPGDTFPWMSWGFLLPVAFVPLFVAMETLPPGGRSEPGRFKESISYRAGKRAFLLAWICGATMALIAFFWTTYPALLFGKLPPWIAYPVFALYAVLSGLFFPTILFPFVWNASRRARKARPFPVLYLVLASTALEIVTPRFFYWTIGSLMHSVESINQWSSVFGFAGASAFVLFSNAILARALTHEPRTPLRFGLHLAGVALFWLALAGYGKYRIAEIDASLASAPKTRIGYIQPNFTFSELSSNPTRPPDAQEQSLENVLRMSRDVVRDAGAQKPELIVWPESVAPFEFAWSKSQVEKVLEFARETQVPILVQATEFDKQELEKVGYRNVTLYSASFLLRPDGSRSSSFRKWVPIPFGETVPLEKYLPFLGDLVRANVGNTSKVGIGTSFEALAYSPQFYVAPLICFDSIYPELPRLQALQGNANIFVNQANFVWMGMSTAGAQFMELDRFRAIENARSLLAVSNTGPTIAFDPAGRALFPSTKLMTQSYGVVELPVLTESTFYTRFGDMPLILGGLFSVFGMFLFVSRRGR